MPKLSDLLWNSPPQTWQGTKNQLSGLLAQQPNPAYSTPPMGWRDYVDAASMSNVPGVSDVASGVAAADDLRKGNKLGALLNGMGALPFIPAITVWHGSPHKFPPTKNNPLGEFDLSKIGTGEGAQAYGHGAYLAESPGVAQSYREGLSKGPPLVNGAPYNFADANEFAAAILAQSKGNKAAAINFINGELKFAKPGSNAESKLNAALLNIQHNDSLPKADLPGYTYKVDLPDEAVARFLDWDKPLSQQAPEVQAAFESRVSPIRAEMAKPADPGWGDLAAPSNFDPTGQELLGLLRNRDASLTAQQFLGNGLGPDISTALKQQGIPGIRYLDGGSRGAGQGTSNYVVFDPSILKILERQ